MGSIALPLSSSPQSTGGVPTYLNIELLYRVGHIDRLAWQDTDICEIYFLNEYESAHQDLYNDVIKKCIYFFMHKIVLLSMGMVLLPLSFAIAMERGGPTLSNNRMLLCNGLRRSPHMARCRRLRDMLSRWSVISTVDSICWCNKIKWLFFVRNLLPPSGEAIFSAHFTAFDFIQ